MKFEAVFTLVAAAIAAAAVVANSATPPERWLVTLYRPDGSIDRSLVTARVERDGCSVSLPDEGLVLVGDPEHQVRIERWR